MSERSFPETTSIEKGRHNNLRAINGADHQLPSQPWGPIVLEVRFVSVEQKAFQTLRFADDVTRDALSFRRMKAGQPIDRLGDAPMNQRVALAQLDVASRGVRKRLELLNRYFLLLERAFWKSSHRVQEAPRQGRD